MAKTFKFRGEAYWARVYEGNHDEFGGKEFYKITVALDDASWDTFNKSGLKLKPKGVSSDDDTLGITFRRDVHAKTGVDKKGKPWTLGGGAPRVVDVDGDEFDDLIGNGSVVEVLVERYPSKVGKWGHRLEAVKVIEHVQYEAPDDDEEDEVEEPEVKQEEKTTKKTNKKDLPF